MYTFSLNASAQQKINILIVDGFSNHDWKQTTQKIKNILGKVDHFTIDVSTAPNSKGANIWNQWQPNFSEYDVVIQNTNGNQDKISWPQAIQRKLENYVNNGGGLYILHSANNAFPEWSDYNRMIGLGWRGKNFGPAVTIDKTESIIKVPAGQGDNTGHGKRNNTLLTRIGNHPIHQGFPKTWLAADLEVYRYARGPAENLTVISYALEQKTQLNFPVEWIITYGKGSVYNSTYGHYWKTQTNPPGMRCVAFQTSLIRALQWLSTGTVTYPIPTNFPNKHSIQLN